MSQFPPISEVAKKLGLIAHEVEGGYFLETYCSQESIPGDALPERFVGNRRFCSQIYYVIVGEQISSFHIMDADETWHYYLGSPVCIVEITPEGKLIETILGPDIMNGQVPQYTVMAGNILGGYNIDTSDYSLVGCTVSPAMILDDYEHCKPEDLLAKFPQHKAIIEKLTWKADQMPQVTDSPILQRPNNLK